MENKSPDGLINVLLDSSSTISEKDDAAMDLGDFDDEKALEALIAIAIDSKGIDDIILYSSGESIARIWDRGGRFDINIYKKLNPLARQEIYAYLFSKRPQWIEIMNNSSNLYNN